jgi:hypothetical protein
MAHQRRKELFSRVGFDPLDNGAERNSFHKRVRFIRRIPRARIILPVLHSGFDISFVQNWTKAGKHESFTGENNGP